jgi:tRNA/rRNA methyltransferase
MPGAGTDKTKNWVAAPAPIVVLVEPQMGENIGAAARAMANFGLSRLRLVKPVQGWPNPKAKMMAAGADRVLENAVLYDSLKEAIADCTLVLASTARQHDQAKPVCGAEEAARVMAPGVTAGENVAIVFGRERNGLENHEVGLADRIITLPVNPAFASLNLAQAVIVVAYEWFKLSTAGALPFATAHRSQPAAKAQLDAFFANLEHELEKVEFFRPPEKRETMTINLRNIFLRMEPTRQDIQTLHGVILALVAGRKGPAKGGILTGDEATMLRALLAEQGGKGTRAQTAPVRGLSRLLRRNPTDAERILWNALVKDRRLAGRGFKRQVPIGPHVADLVSFPLRLIVDVVPDTEDTDAAVMRAEKRAWVADRGYRVIAVRAADVERDVGEVLETIVDAASPGNAPVIPDSAKR